jgi:transcriptional regulator with GAF, ATPase, and Fis domain
MWQRGEMFHISDVDQLPDEQWREKKYCKDLGGIKSVLFIPLQVGGINCGIISFVSYRVKRSWPDLLIQRLRLLSDIIENALERKRADEKIQQALAKIEELKNRLEAENLYLRDQIELEQKHDEIVGQSAAIRKVLLRVETVAATDSTVLLLGETGTGKELLARALHNLSGRKSRTMIKVNCAALPASLIEMELFGREKGAYTGAFASQVGRFEAANGSTIFLDEIGELPLELQSKLLRVLQEGQFERLGSSTPINVDVRVIAATNRDLAKAVREGTFREDLYYRLNVFPISVPPLRERVEDIPLLVWAMVKEFGATFGKSIERIPKKNMDALKHHAWPGNIRELRNMIERAMIVNNGSTLVVDLPDSPSTITTRSLEEIDRTHIISVLESTGWRVRGKNYAADILGIKPTTLEAKMKKLGIFRKPA